MGNVHHSCCWRCSGLFSPISDWPVAASVRLSVATWSYHIATAADHFSVIMINRVGSWPGWYWRLLQIIALYMHIGSACYKEEAQAITRTGDMFNSSSFRFWSLARVPFSFTFFVLQFPTAKSKIAYLLHKLCTSSCFLKGLTHCSQLSKFHLYTRLWVLLERTQAIDSLVLTTFKLLSHTNLRPCQMFTPRNGERCYSWR